MMHIGSGMMLLAHRSPVSLGDQRLSLSMTQSILHAEVCQGMCHTVEGRV